MLEVYNRPELVEGLVKFWKNVPLSPEISDIYMSLVSEADLNIIYNNTKKQDKLKFLDEFKKYICLEQ